MKKENGRIGIRKFRFCRFFDSCFRKSKEKCNSPVMKKLEFATEVTDFRMAEQYYLLSA